MGHTDQPIEAITSLAFPTISNRKTKHEIRHLRSCLCLDGYHRSCTSYRNWRLWVWLYYWKQILCKHCQLDSIQGALTDIEAAGTDLETIKGKLEALVDGAPKVYAAEAALETAVDSAAYTNAFIPDTR